MKAMKVIRNLLVIVGLMAVAGQAYAYGAPTYHHARYSLRNDTDVGWMGTVRLVHCDTPTPKLLERVKVDRANGVVTYRCV